jgi:DMSO/TMAO reductase YedYZ heme-binding membrane subunit
MSAVLAAGTSSRALWYATRGTGVISLVLLTAIVWLGVAGVRRFRNERWPRFLVVGLHRNLTLVSLAFLAIHIGTNVLDGFAPISLKDAFIPFVSAYRPIWLGLGAVAFDLLLALTITSLLRARLGYRTWRLLHWLAYVAWPVALVHALGTGSDARVLWLQALAATAIVAVCAAVFVRLRGTTAPARGVAGAAVAVVVLGTFVWYKTGPDRHGWAARAGTPQSLVARATPRAAAARTVARPALVPSPPFNAQLSGRLTSSADPGTGLVLVNIRGHVRGGARGVLWIRLQGQPVDGGGVSMTASGASFGTIVSPAAYVGKIVALDGTRILLALRNSQGDRMSVSLDLQVDRLSNGVSGSVVAQAGTGESQ